MGNTLQQYIQASRWRSFYLFSGQEIPTMLQGEILAFYCTFVLLRGHIFASIEKFGSHVWNVANESLVAYTDLFVSLVYSWFNSTHEWHSDQLRSRCCLLLIILIAVKLIALLIQVQIYLAVLAIAHSFGKLCLTAKENYVAWHKLDEYKKQTECRIVPYKRVPFKKYSYLDSIKICSLKISS